MNAEIVIQKLKSIGYQIRMDGQDILLNSDNDPPDPELATNLLTELKKYKAEAVNILKMGDTITPTEKTQSGANMKTVWLPEVQSHVDWFATLKEPTEPFYLEPHRKIVDPVKYFSALWMDITAGPAGPRARMGSLQCDLRKLKAYLN
jgi:hypothetical protein